MTEKRRELIEYTSTQAAWDENPAKVQDERAHPEKGINRAFTGHGKSVLGGGIHSGATREHQRDGVELQSGFSGHATADGQVPAQHTFTHEPRTVRS